MLLANHLIIWMLFPQLPCLTLILNHLLVGSQNIPLHKAPTSAPTDFIIKGEAMHLVIAFPTPDNE